MKLKILKINKVNLFMLNSLGNRRSGFLSLISTIIISMSTLFFSFTVLDSAISYLDSVSLRELRIQNNLNAKSCLNVVTSMVSRDYFLSGRIEIDWLDCIANIENNMNGEVSFFVETKLGTVDTKLTRNLRLQDFTLSIL